MLLVVSCVFQRSSPVSEFSERSAPSHAPKYTLSRMVTGVEVTPTTPSKRHAS